MPAKALIWIVVVAAALAAALWWGRARVGALPGLRSTVSLPAPVAAPAAARARKCIGANGGVSYTDGACPPGQREQGMDGGTVSVLPAPAPAAASTPSPLRRLAGDGAPAAVADRVVDQALQR